MIYPKRNKFIRAFFDWYINRIIKTNFHGIDYNDVTVDAGKSVLVIANHFSWWDGFLMYYVNQRAIKKNFHVMVIEDTVKKVSFFKYMGAFSVNKQSRDMVTSLNYAAQLLQDPENLLLIFPQGKLHSNFTGVVNFEKGLLKIMKSSTGKYQTVLSAIFIENMQHKKPTASVYLTVPAQGSFNAEDVSQVYASHYNKALAVQSKKIV